MVMPPVTPEEARQFLRDASPLWRAFWFHMHLMAKNLAEFADGLEAISDDVFAYHCSGQKNDLAKWVREVVGDSVLAEQLFHAKTHEMAATTTRARVRELQTVASL